MKVSRPRGTGTFSRLLLCWVGVVWADLANHLEPKSGFASEHTLMQALPARCGAIYRHPSPSTSQLCTDRPPYTLYGDPATQCTQYFWCGPERGACVMDCPPGQVFNRRCQCCQEGQRDGDTSEVDFDVGICAGATPALAA